MNGEYFALRNRCPHQGGPLREGKLGAWIAAAAPGAYEVSRSDEMLRCSWHGWEFDLRTGRSWWAPERQRVRPYAVSVVRPGPYIAETFMGAVDPEYVLVEVE